MSHSATLKEPRVFSTLAESIVNDLCECPVCHRESIGQDCLRAHVREVADRWNSIVTFQEHLGMSAELRDAFGVIDDVDAYRQHGRNIPRERIAETLQALQVIERNKVTA